MASGGSSSIPSRRLTASSPMYSACHCSFASSKRSSSISSRSPIIDKRSLNSTGQGCQFGGFSLRQRGAGGWYSPGTAATSSPLLSTPPPLPSPAALSVLHVLVPLLLTLRLRIFGSTSRMYASCSSHEASTPLGRNAAALRSRTPSVPETTRAVLLLSFEASTSDMSAAGSSEEAASTHALIVVVGSV